MHTVSKGGLVAVLIEFSNPKYVANNNTGWQLEGHDACRTERTTASTNMEWCLASRSQVRVLSIKEVSIATGATGPVFAEPPAPAPAPAPAACRHCGESFNSRKYTSERSAKVSLG